MDETTNTPVGTSFMERFTDYEVTEGLGAGGDGGAIEPAAVEPVAPAAAEPAPAAAQPAGWMPSGPDELRGIVFGAIEELLNQPSPQEPVQLPEYDPFNAEVVQQHALGAVQEMFEREIGPLRDLLGSFAEERGRHEATKALDEVAGEIGEFDRDQAVQGAAWLVSQGVHPRQAIRQAAENVRAYEQRVREAVLAEQASALKNMHDPAHVEPAGGGAASEVVDVPTGPDRYRVQLKRSIAAQTGVGLGAPAG